MARFVLLTLFLVLPSLAMARDKNSAIGWDTRPIGTGQCPGPGNENIVTMVRQHMKADEWNAFLAQCGETQKDLAHANVVQVDAATRQQSMNNSFATGIPVAIDTKNGIMASGDAAVMAMRFSNGGQYGIPLGYQIGYENRLYDGVDNFLAGGLHVRDHAPPADNDVKTKVVTVADPETAKALAEAQATITAQKRTNKAQEELIAKKRKELDALKSGK